MNAHLRFILLCVLYLFHFQHCVHGSCAYYIIVHVYSNNQPLSSTTFNLAYFRMLRWYSLLHTAGIATIIYQLVGLALLVLCGTYSSYTYLHRELPFSCRYGWKKRQNRCFILMSPALSSRLFILLKTTSHIHVHVHVQQLDNITPHDLMPPL